MSLFRVAVLISGAGSTLQNLIQWKCAYLACCCRHWVSTSLGPGWIAPQGVMHTSATAGTGVNGYGRERALSNDLLDVKALRLASAP